MPGGVVRDRTLSHTQYGGAQVVGGLQQNAGEFGRWPLTVHFFVRISFCIKFMCELLFILILVTSMVWGGRSSHQDVRSHLSTYNHEYHIPHKNPR